MVNQKCYAGGIFRVKYPHDHFTLFRILGRFSDCNSFSSFRPLNQSNPNNIEMGMCCTCYPCEDDEEDTFQHMTDVMSHPYVASTTSEASPASTQLQGDTV